jgi:DNA-binding winged helix-turn-helix (wHTH) protein/Tol biopolymer transport system component
MPRYAFGPFSLDPEARILLRDGVPVPIPAKSLDTLVVLVENRGRLVDKDELLSRVWPGIVVEEANINQSIFTVRKILGDSPKNHRYIATVAGRGYQFVAPVTEPAPAGVSSDGQTTASPPKQRKRSLQVGAVAVGLALGVGVWFALHRSSKPVPELTQRRVTFNSASKTVAGAAISPDGKYVAYSDTRGIHVKLLSTSEERTFPAPGETLPETIFHVVSWFPDGTRLLGNSAQRDGRENIWAASVMGQSSRQLRRDAWAWQISPDGAQIAFSPNQPFESYREIWISDTEKDNPHKVLGLPDTEWLSSVRWSPDGRRFAYIRTQRQSNAYVQWIETCDLKGRNRTSLLAVSDRDPRVRDLVWLKDWRVIYSRLEPGSDDTNDWRVLYSRLEPGSDDANLWQIRVDRTSGEPISPPRRMTNWAGSNLVGLTASADGSRIALCKETLRGQVWLGDLISPGHMMGLPRRLTNEETSDFAWDWTADSKAVILESDVTGKPNIFKQSIGAEEPEPLVMGPKAATSARLSPDGAWVLYTETEPTFVRGQVPVSRLMRVPVNGGSPQLIFESRSRDLRTGAFNCSRSPASVCLLAEIRMDQNRLMLVAFDPYTGKQKLLRSIEISPNVDEPGMMSPDGSTFAVFTTVGQVDTRVRLLSLSGGSDREITVKWWLNFRSLDWSADGKGFYSGSASPEASTLIYVDLQGAAHLVWRDRLMSRIASFGIPSPDNRHLAITGFVHNRNVWTIENF